MSTGTLSDSFLDELPDDLPPALVVDVADPDVGQCKECGIPVRRPNGESPTGRKLRIPKFCDDCKAAPKAASGTVTRRRRSTNPDIAKGMTELYSTVGLLILPKDPQLGMMIVGEKRLQELMGQQDGPAPSIAEAAGNAWAHVAANNPMVADLLGPMLKTSVWAELMAAHLPVVGYAMSKPRTGRVKNFMTKLRIRRRVRAGGEATDG